MKCLTTVIFCFTVVLSAVESLAEGRSLQRLQRSVKVDKYYEYDVLKELLGRPKGNPVAAPAIKGTKKITRLHKLCAGKKRDQSKPDLAAEWSEDTTLYDKVICGMYTMKDEYKKHERHAAQILAGKHSDKSLDVQKKYLLDAVANMAKSAGPLPSLRFMGR